MTSSMDDLPTSIVACHELILKQRKEKRKLRRECESLRRKLQQVQGDTERMARQGISKDTSIEFLEAPTGSCSSTVSGDLSSSTRSLTSQDFERRNRDLEEANKKMKLQSAAQLQNFAMMSHEIRTPLNCIIGLSSLLVETELDESQEESLRMIVRSGDLLLSVVNDVLDYSRLESGNCDIHLEPTDLEGIVDLVLHAMSTKAGQRKIEINKSIDGSLPRLVRTDGSRVQQILYNLLGNAVKFSKEGSCVDFSVAVVCNSGKTGKKSALSNERTLRFTVKDYGKGIEKDQLENVFLPFHQGSDGTSRSFGGTGLGLAITAKLVKGLHGSISVDSKLGEWSEFIVDLPCVEEPSNPQGPLDEPIVIDKSMFFSKIQDSLGASNHSRSSSFHSSPASSPAASPSQPIPKKTIKVKVRKTKPVIPNHIRILVVDDNVVNRKILVQMLRRIGAKTVDTAENGLEACNMEEENAYDLILMDIEMPVMDGLQATKKILSRERRAGTDKPKIVFVTAHALGAFHAKAVKAGGCGFLTKPFNLKKLTSLFHSVDMHLGCRSLPKNQC